jgi:hypothetical protein
MNGERVTPSSRNRWFASLVVLAVFGILSSATGAKAGCGMPAKPGAIPAFPLLTPIPHSQDGDHSGARATIVGLWHVVYTATYTTSGPLPVPMVPPAGPFLFAETLKTWHADGTEWEQKIAPPPSGFCFGVWKHTAKGSVKLHHIGAILASDGSVMNIFYMDEINRVAPDGKTYSGTWDMKIYDPTDVMGKGTVLQEISGTTAAERITVD